MQKIIDRPGGKIIEEDIIIDGASGQYLTCCPVKDPQGRPGIPAFSCEITGSAIPVKNIIVNAFNVKGKVEPKFPEPGSRKPPCTKISFDGLVECFVGVENIGGTDARTLACFSTESPVD